MDPKYLGKAIIKSSKQSNHSHTLRKKNWETQQQNKNKIYEIYVKSKNICQNKKRPATHPGLLKIIFWDKELIKESRV